MLRHKYVENNLTGFFKCLPYAHALISVSGRPISVKNDSQDEIHKVISIDRQTLVIKFFDRKHYLESQLSEILFLKNSILLNSRPVLSKIVFDYCVLNVINNICVILFSHLLYTDSIIFSILPVGPQNLKYLLSDSSWLKL